jgi:hypothetical protein
MRNALAGCHRSWFAFRLADSGEQQSRISIARPGQVSDAINCVAALGELLVRADLTSPLKDINRKVFLGETGEETADGVRHGDYAVLLP